METLAKEIQNLADHCHTLSEQDRVLYATDVLENLLAKSTLNPTGDDPALTGSKAMLDIPMPSPALRVLLTDFISGITQLEKARQLLSQEQRDQLAESIRVLIDQGFLHSHLVEKFKVPANRDFLEKGFSNADSIWQMAMVAHWALSEGGLQRLSKQTWDRLFPDLPLQDLIDRLLKKITFRHIPTLRLYRRDAMHHYPRLSKEEFSLLQGDQWRDVIDHSSGRKPEDDIPFITPVIKQGDIEHSLYRHYLMPDLLKAMRNATPGMLSQLDFNHRDRDLLYGIPFVIQQVEQELYAYIKNTIEQQIRTWAENLGTSLEDTSLALAVTEKIWGYRRTPAAHECNSPVDNLIKGFTATVRNAFNHLTDVNFAASAGCPLDPMAVSEKFVLFASVSNGQLDNLATAHDRYIRELDNPANWDNEIFFSHFLAVNRESDPHHIQAHFIVDKTRGCPAIPQITRFHEIVMDLILNFVIREFGETNVRGAGAWFLKEKTPSGFA